MGYAERKPIYEAYEKIIKAIIDEKKYKEYAISEINAFDEDLLSQFRMIREKLLSHKYSE